MIKNNTNNGGFVFWSAGVTAAPDGWSLVGAGAGVDRIVDKKEYGVKITRNGTNCYLGQNTIHQEKGINYWRGKTVTAGCFSVATQANTVQIQIYDGIDDTLSSFHAGDSAYEYLTVTHTINANATSLEIRLRVITNDVFGYFDEVVLVEGNAIQIRQKVEYLLTATSQFLSLQSGLARPYWEVNFLISGTAATYNGLIGQCYEPNNDIVSIGAIDREKSIGISGTDKLIAGDVTFRLSNNSGSFSPLNQDSIFYNRDWFNSTFNIYAGFVNTSGTALVLQKGSFLLEEVEIDSKGAYVNLKCKDRLKYSLEKYLGLPQASGTANARLWTGTYSSKAIMTDLMSGMGIDSANYDLTAGIDFNNLTVSGKTYGETLAKLSAASDGFMFVDNVGKIKFRLNTANFGAARQTWNIGTNNTILKTKYNINISNLINSVGIKYEESLASFNLSENTAGVPKGRTFLANNQIIQTRAQAQTFTTRNLADFSTALTLLEIDNLWMPAVEISDYFLVTDPNIYLSGTQSRTFEVYKIRDDFMNLSQKMYMREISAGLKFGYLSDTGSDANSVIYTGAWTSGYCFLSFDSGTAAYPGFDAATGETPVHSGGNNNALDNSGIPNSSIEEPFILG